MHGFRKFRPVGSNQQVIVIVHQQEGDNVNFEAVGHSPKRKEKCVTVAVGKRISCCFLPGDST